MLKKMGGSCMIKRALFSILLLVMQTSKPHDLVELTTIDPRIKLDIKYATDDNFCKQVLYPLAKCFVHRDCAEALKRVQDALALRGLSLKIFDGYRPLSVQQLMWDIVQDENYVTNPAKNRGRHTRGTAVDLTLVDASGHELEMPSTFDDFTERAHRNNPAHSEAARTHMKILQEAMEAEGFVGFKFEWWHYDLIDWNDDVRYPPLDISLAEL
jgi:D-alanyl-D-alanine dipeptidase